jgi:hypothetical protein
MGFAPVDIHTIRAEFGDWRWLVGADAELVAVTVLGDAFVRREAAGTLSFLDTLEGQVEDTGEADIQQLLGSEERASRWLFPDIVQALAAHRLTSGQCFSATKPAALGGKREPANYTAIDAAVHFSIMGQFLERIASLPPGTPFHVTIGRSQWWKFW